MPKHHESWALMKATVKLLFVLCGFGVDLFAIPAHSQTCHINSVSNGTLTLSTSSQLVANDTVGTPGNLNITCSAGTTFTVISVTNNGTLSTINDVVDGVFSGIRSDANLIARGEISPSGSLSPVYPPGIASAIQTGAINNRNYAVDLSIFRTSFQMLPAGTYTYRVSILLAPQ